MSHSALVTELRRRLGAENVLSAPSELAVYDCDASTLERHRPDAIALPRSTAEVAATVEACHRHAVPVIARGAGTGRAGGSVPLGGGVVLMLTRLNRIVEIDLRDRMALVEAGVPIARLAAALAGTGLHVAPDPTSQAASTLGGNVATNAGGPRSLKYGAMIHHVLGLEAVLADGSIVHLGPPEDPAGLDLVGVLVGSEGTLAIVTRVWLRLTSDAESRRTLHAVFNTVDAAADAVGRIAAAGIVPAALELIDRSVAAMLKESLDCHLSSDDGAVAIIELDGSAAGVAEQFHRLSGLCREAGAREIGEVRDPQRRERLWRSYRSLAGSLGRLSPCPMILDGVVPPTRLPEVFRRIAQIGESHGLNGPPINDPPVSTAEGQDRSEARSAKSASNSSPDPKTLTFAHAGEGIVHAAVLLDDGDADQVQRARAAGRALLEECVRLGGSITAEYGVGIAKIGLMDRCFLPQDLRAMARVRRAFDPAGRLNPGKVLTMDDDREE